MHELNWSLACLYIFRKAKGYSPSYWVGMVKYSCDLLGHTTLKSALYQG